MNNYLIHYGVSGQKWGKRNYQYEDGSLTPEGRVHYGVGERRKAAKNYQRSLNKLDKKRIRAEWEHNNVNEQIRSIDKSISKNIAKGRADKNAKLESRREELSALRAGFEETAQKHISDANKILDEANAAGLTVSAIPTLRTPYKPSEWALMMAVTIPLTALGGTTIVPIDQVAGYRWTVKDEKKQ